LHFAAKILYNQNGTFLDMNQKETFLDMDVEVDVEGMPITLKRGL